MPDVDTKPVVKKDFDAFVRQVLEDGDKAPQPMVEDKFRKKRLYSKDKATAFAVTICLRNWNSAD